MAFMIQRLFLRPLSVSLPRNPIQPLMSTRTARYQAFDATFDRDDLTEARKWHKSFDIGRLPKGHTTFARSSGPGGQHVNKTESKAITIWPIKDILAILPNLLHRGVRSSKYYTSRSDALTFQAQEHRHRGANTDENVQKLFEEIQRIYAVAVPRESSPSKAKRHADIEKSFHHARLKQKKIQSAKKQLRRGSDGF